MAHGTWKCVTTLNVRIDWFDIFVGVVLLVCFHEEKKKTKCMEACFEERVGEEIAQYPNLYNLPLQEYKDKQIGANSWREITATFGHDESTYKKKWQLTNNLITHYCHPLDNGMVGMVQMHGTPEQCGPSFVWNHRHVCVMRKSTVICGI